MRVSKRYNDEKTAGKEKIEKNIARSNERGDPSSYGCTRDVGRTRKKRKSYSRQ